MGHVYTKNDLLLARDSDFTGERVFYLAAILHSSLSPAPVSSLPMISPRLLGVSA